MKKVDILKQYANGGNDADGSRRYYVELGDGKTITMSERCLIDGFIGNISGKDSKGKQTEYEIRIKGKEVSEVFNTKEN
jgi:hypothetical protein